MFNRYVEGEGTICNLLSLRYSALVWIPEERNRTDKFHRGSMSKNFIANFLLRCRSKTN